MGTWEDQFREWAKPPGTTETQRCDNAVSSIKNAINNSSELNQRNIIVFLQGSYRNNTNVRKDSDVDVGVLLTDTFFYDPLPDGLTPESLGFGDSDYAYSTFKSDIGKALTDHFGLNSVTRGNKAFNIRENSYHVEADVAAFYEHRRYNLDRKYYKGVELRTDKENNRIINWPEQHYSNGTEKNKETGTRYKSIVRILKSLSNHMTMNKIVGADIPGFLIECMVWNVPNENFNSNYYTSDVRSVLAFLFNNTHTYEQCKHMVEVSHMKYLFGSHQKWSSKQAHAFVSVAWDYIGFED